MTDHRRIFALLGSVRRGVDAIVWLEEHNLPVPAEHVELVALIAGELAEALEELREGPRP